jgi:hypothetical protein
MNGNHAWRLSIEFMPDEYDEIRAAMIQGRPMPATIEEWERDDRMTEARHRAMGGRSRKVLVRRDAFIQYCSKERRAPSLAVLRLYAGLLCDEARRSS